MKSILSVILIFSFLLQSFATVQAMPYREGKLDMQCMVKKESLKKHSCCTMATAKKEASNKKDCCSGTSKMSCCVMIVAIYPIEYHYSFSKISTANPRFGYHESISNYRNKIFHPPILASLYT
ncbi:hypothetical protein ACXGQW_03735 [Wenyingzhuangia sp. IMCC45533]